MRTERIERIEQLSRAAELLRGGGLVGVPTETVYGLAGNALNTAAVEEIYRVKGRPEIKPLSLMVAGPEALDRYCEPVPPAARFLAERYWPGPLTLVLRSKKMEPAVVRAGGDTVGLRCPDHPLTLALLRQAGFPLAAPSANPSGAPSPRTAAELLRYFDGKIPAVVDGGPCGLGRESTLLDLSAAPYRIVREGALPREELFRALGESVSLIGITGGSGCGKTTALNVLSEMGVLLIDADAVYHRLTASDPDLRAELIERYGSVYEGERLDRKQLAAIVFRDPAALADLNRITHKYVTREIDWLLTEHALWGGALAAVDAVALPDSPLFSRTLCNVAVTAPEEDRIRRIAARDGITPKAARERVAAQHGDAYYVSRCNAELRNDGSQMEFQTKCEAFFYEVLKEHERREKESKYG